MYIKTKKTWLPAFSTEIQLSGQLEVKTLLDLDIKSFSLVSSATVQVKCQNTLLMKS